MADDDFDVDTGTDETDEVEGNEETVDDKPALRDDGKPYTAADIAKLKESLTKARKDARTAKRTVAPPKDEGEVDQTKAEVDAARKDAERYKTVGIRQAAKAAFAEAGLSLSGNQFARAFKMLDLDDLTIADDGEVDGLEDQIDEIKDDFPTWFEDKTKKRAPRVNTGRSSEDSSGKKEEEASETLAKMLFRGRA